MSKKDSETERRIKETARDLYFKEGKFGATTQEIADAAGVNRTLINYYFRSRDNLFDIIFKEAIEREEFLSEKLLYSDLPFKKKIEKYIEQSFQQSREFPYLESYIVSRLNEGFFYKKTENWKRFIERFENEFQEEIRKGNIIEMDSLQFILNLSSLISFPFAARPLFKSSFRVSDEEYEQIMDQRKQIIMKVLFK